jgi:ribonuclease Z
MKIHIIGSGCPDPRAKRYGSAFILEVGKDFIMIDCGPATTYKMAIMGLKPAQVEYLFLTHHHSDHNADFPCFSLTRWDLDNGSLPPLKVYGPVPTRRFVDLLIGSKGAFAPDIQSRLVHPASHACHQGRGGTLPRHEMNVEVHDVDSGKVAETDLWSATATRVQHVEPGLISLAYRFDTNEGSILFAGDCAGCDSLKELAQGVDTLVMCCTHFGNISRDITDVVAGTPDVAETAREAGVSRVILTHANQTFSEIPGVREKAISEVARNYDGAIFFPDEFTTIDTA